MISPNNPFIRLHKWASRQDENFVTECFALVLQQLLDEEPEAAVILLKRLTHGFLARPATEAKLIAVTTQIVLTEGRPDLAISTPDELVYVEIKVESELGPTQLSRYRRMLLESGVNRTALFLLTRYPVTLEASEAQPDGFVRWYEVAEALEAETRHHAMKPASAFLVRQFVEFLQARSMVMSQVTYELSGGVRALRNLLEMLAEAVAMQHVSTTDSSKRGFAGFLLDNRKFWLGVEYDEPDRVSFYTWCRIDADAARKLGLGSVHEEKQAAGGFQWTHHLDLNAEDIHFYGRSKASQMQCLEQFVRECLAAARRIELPISPGQEVVEESNGDG